MIPQSAITEWSNQVPWQSNEQIEQDLVICRSLIEIYNDEFLAHSLAFRGGTALHKLFLLPQTRYSEDIDLVQIRAEGIKETVSRLQKCLSFIGRGSVERKSANTTIKFRFISEIQPVVPLRLKVETNCREHFTALGYQQTGFKVESSWFDGSCQLTTYKLEELLGTKLRALYQRKKGRDLYDLYKALINKDVNIADILRCYREYMAMSVLRPPTVREFLINLEEKMNDSDFTGDTVALLRPGEEYDIGDAFDFVRVKILERLS